MKNNHWFLAIVSLLCGCANGLSPSLPASIRNAAGRFDDKRVQELVRAGLEEDLVKMRRLIAEGVDINKVGDSFVTPLFVVMAAKKRNAFLLLVSNGANVHWQIPDQKHDFFGESAFSLASKSNDHWFLEQMLAFTDQLEFINPEDASTALGAAVFAGEFESVKLLIRAGANLDYTNPKLADSTPMQIAASAKRYDIVWELLNAGANPDIPNSAGRRLRTFVEESLASDRGLHPEMHKWCLKVKARLDEREATADRPS